MGEIITSLTDHHSEALLLYQKFQIISNKLFLVDPLNTKLQRGLAVGYYNVALVSAKVDDTKTALDSSRKALSMLNELSSADPQNEDLRQTVAAAQIVVCQMMIRTGNAAEAITLLHQSRATVERLFASSPTDAIAQFRIATVQEMLGTGYVALASDRSTPVQKRLVHWGEAQSWFEKSLKIYKSFRDTGKTTGEDAAKVDVITMKECRVAKRAHGRWETPK